MLAVSNRTEMLVAIELMTPFRHPNLGAASSLRSKQEVVLSNL